MVQKTAEEFVGTEPERLCYNALIQIWLASDLDFTVQTSLLGVRMDKGGLVVDFVIENPPDLAISVLGVYLHYRLGGGTRARDRMTGEGMAQSGIALV